MKHLMSLFGLDLQGLTTQEGVTAAALDPRRHTLSVFATSEVHISISQIINGYAAEDVLPKGEENEVHCCVCLSPVDNPKNIIRLEYCGHAYCLDCIQSQVSLKRLKEHPQQ